MTRIAINGFGRIGRAVAKIALKKDDLELVAINDLTSIKTLAHLFKYDSVYRKYVGDVKASDQGIIVDGKLIKVLSERSPANLPWKELGIDIAVESTGIFATASSERGGYKDHIKAGAKKVLLTVPAKDKIDQTIVLGVNGDELDISNDAFSNASCTTNCLSPVAKVLNDNFVIEKGLMTTIHAFTNDQVVHDMPHSDLRRSRSCSSSIIPTTTGATRAVGLVIPDLLGKMDGCAMRVPIITGSLVDFVAILKKDVTVQEINDAVKKAAEGQFKGVLEYTEDPIVSVDIIQNTHSSIFDALSTMVVGGNFVKVVSWYDNEWGYSNRVVELLSKIGEKL